MLDVWVDSAYMHVCMHASIVSFKCVCLLLFDHIELACHKLCVRAYTCVFAFAEMGQSFSRTLSLSLALSRGSSVFCGLKSIKIHSPSVRVRTRARVCVYSPKIPCANSCNCYNIQCMFSLELLLFKFPKFTSNSIKYWIWTILSISEKQHNGTNKNQRVWEWES